MQRATFETELAKYKVVREADFYRPRPKKLEQRQSAPKPENAVRRAVTAPQNVDQLPFWDQMRAAASSFLNDDETEKFINEMKTNYESIHELVNLEDLNLAASML